MYSKDYIDYSFKAGFLPRQKRKLALNDSLGLCRYCLETIQLLKSGKHLRTHYRTKIDFLRDHSIISSQVRCEGSRTLDYRHSNIMLISKNLEVI